MLKIYGVPLSVHTRKVIVTAIEKKLQYENIPVIPFDPPAGWDKLSPTGKIPALVDGDVTLADSSVICTYLERTHPTNPLYPRETKDYVQALWFEEYADGTLFPQIVHGLFFQKIIRPNILKQSTDTDAMDAILLNAMPKIFGYLEDSIRGDYLAGNQFSVADIALTSNLINYHYLGFTVDAARYPKLAAYFSKQLRRPSFVTALTAEQPAVAGMGLDRSFVSELTAAA
jgi:glutathione S-transferase